MASSTSRKKTPIPPKTSLSSTKGYRLSDRGYVESLPKEQDIATKEDGARYLPIEVVERDLDRWAWSTQNFTYQQYRSLDKFGAPCISASLELIIPWTDDNGKIIERRLTGACNFPVASYAPNGHFVATAKSECVKNAASDLGRRFGRDLNAMIVKTPTEPLPEVPLEAIKNSIAKRKPDKDMLEQIRKAQERGDTAALAIYGNIYEINTEENGE